MGGYIIGKAMTDCIALHKEFDHMRPIVYSISTSFGPYVLHNLKIHHGRLMNKTITGIDIISAFSTENRLFKIIAEALDLRILYRRRSNSYININFITSRTCRKFTY